MADSESSGAGSVIERVIGVLIACWCLIPVFLVFGFFFWAALESAWPWTLLFAAAAVAVFLAFVVWGGRLCAECRRRREGGAGGGG